MEVLRRNIVFIDLAIAQIIGLVIVLIGHWIEGANWVILQVVCLSTALLVALFFRWIERVVPLEQEAVIGSSFILAACVTLLLLDNNPHGADEFAHVLSGQLLFVTWLDILLFLPVYVAVLAVWIFVPRYRSGMGFFILFAFTITVSVQLVGVYVVFASLILPALAARVGEDYNIKLAIVSGGLAVLAAILASMFSDVPLGAFMVVCFVASAALFRLVRPFINRVESSPQ